MASPAWRRWREIPLLAPLAGDPAPRGAGRCRAAAPAAAGAGAGRRRHPPRSVPPIPPGTPTPSGSSGIRLSEKTEARRWCGPRWGRPTGHPHRTWESRKAAGNHGDLYDNRDRGHSRLDPGAHPQLAFVGYSDAAEAAGLDYGLNASFLFDHPPSGIPRPRSPTGRSGAACRAGDDPTPTAPGRSGSARTPRRTPSTSTRRTRTMTPKNGDLFPANTPYLLVSRGSSGSDQPFLEALAMTSPPSAPTPRRG